MAGIAAASSWHITAIINTLLLEPDSRRDRVRFLDLGYGDGRLLDYMIGSLALLQPEVRFKAFGIGVSDAGQLDSGYIRTTRIRLREKWPQIDWNERMILYARRSGLFQTGASISSQASGHGARTGSRKIRRRLRLGGVIINL
jgi:hypothetical protein